MNTTALIRNFHELMTSCLSPLLKAGVTVGDDEWDDFTELAFEILVCVPIERQIGKKIAWRYESWGGDGGPRPQIKARLKRSGVFLVGATRTAKSGEVSITYEEQELIGGSIEFNFRQLGHPFKTEKDKDWLDYVQGEVIDPENGLPVGTCLSLPLDDCEFSVG